jgi:hypothetical protein
MLDHHDRGISHNMINLGKQNETYDLPRLPTLREEGQRPTDTHKRRMTGEGGSKQKVSKQGPVWRIPGAPPPRDIANPGGQCAINVAMQLYFHIPSITSIPGLQQIQALKSNLDRYSKAEGPLTLGHLHSICPQSTKTSAQDVGEILDRIATLIPEGQERIPLTIHLDPETSLYSSLQKCHTWNYSQGDGDRYLHFPDQQSISERTKNNQEHDISKRFGPSEMPAIQRKTDRHPPHPESSSDT